MYPFSGAYSRGADSPSDTLEDMVDSLIEGDEDANAILNRLNPKDAGWVADLISRRILKEQEEMGQEVELELDVSCLLVQLDFAHALSRRPVPRAMSGISVFFL